MKKTLRAIFYYPFVITVLLLVILSEILNSAYEIFLFDDSKKQKDVFKTMFLSFLPKNYFKFIKSGELLS